MYQLILLIPYSVNLKEFDENWPLFLEAVENMPGLIEESLTRVDQVLYGQKTISRIYCFSFPDQETLEKSLLSESGEKAGQLIHDLTNGQVSIMTGEFQEDTLDNIRSHKLPKSKS
jgi:hypothetical protein